MPLKIPFLESFFKNIRSVPCGDDMVDKLNYRYTTMLLLLFSIMISLKQYVGSPIQIVLCLCVFRRYAIFMPLSWIDSVQILLGRLPMGLRRVPLFDPTQFSLPENRYRLESVPCWTQAEFVPSWEQYTNDLCFVQTMFFVPMSEQLPEQISERKQMMTKRLSYYLWIPIVLTLQALCFHIPSLMWRSVPQTGIPLKSVLQRVRKAAQVADIPQRNQELRGVAKFLFGLHQRHLRTRRSFRPKPFMSYLYIFTKFLYLVNIVSQFLILNAFLGFSDFWAITLLKDLSEGRDWEASGSFPRTALCEFETRGDSVNIHQHTVECLLMINTFCEKIYVFLWFWFFLVGVITALNIIYWSILVLPKGRNEGFFVDNLKAAGIVSPFDVRRALVLARSIPQDYHLLLHFVEAYAGQCVVKVLIKELFLVSQEYPGRKKLQNSALAAGTDEVQAVDAAQNSSASAQSFNGGSSASLSPVAASLVQRSSARRHESSVRFEESPA